tara:strand:- start:110 stop:589 length:480 start_codon:yes stop_codon:yes gene_type:complete
MINFNDADENLFERMKIYKLWFRRLIVLAILFSTLQYSIPIIFNFEQYYGLRRFIDQGLITFLLDNEIQLTIAFLIIIFSIISYLMVYLFKPIGKILYTINLVITLLINMFSGDIIEYGILYPLDWLAKISEALILYLMYFGEIKREFIIKKKLPNKHN